MSYATQEDLLVTSAQIGQLSSVFVNKKVTGIEQARVKCTGTSEDALLAMLGIPYGASNPGDKLPIYPVPVYHTNWVPGDMTSLGISLPVANVVTVPFLQNLLELTQFVANPLYLEFDEFSQMMLLKDRQGTANTQAIDNFLSEVNFYEWNTAQDKGYPFAQAVNNLSARFPQYAHLIHAYDEEWERSIIGIIPETVDVVNKLKTSGYTLYGLTNWSGEKFPIIRKRFPVVSLLDYILVSGEVNLLKPDPSIFELFLQKIGRRSEDCLLIDDSIPNIEEARRLGFATYHFSSPAKLILDFQQMSVL